MSVLADQALQHSGRIGLVVLPALVDAKPIAFFDEQVFEFIDTQCSERAEAADGLGDEHPDGLRPFFVRG